MANPLYGQNKADNSIDAAGPTYEEVIAAKTMANADAGGTFGLNLAAGFAVTLPKASSMPAGSRLNFIVLDATADYTITANAADTLIGTIHSTIQAAADATGITIASNVLTFDASGGAAVGDNCELICDGRTKWYARAHCAT